MRHVRRWLPILVSLALIGTLVAYAPWPKIGRVISDVDVGTILVLVVLSLAYYTFKSLRFWYLLQAMGIRRPLASVALSYMSAQPVSLLPAGEIYRSHTLYRYTGVPIRKSAGQFTLQGFLEGSAMALLMLISAAAVGSLRLPALISCIILLIVLILIKADYLARAAQLLNRLPFVHMADKAIEQFSRSNRRALTREWLPKLYGISFVAELIGTGIAFTAVVGIGGHINFFAAAFLYIIPIIVGFFSFLPGGIGISEQSAVGILLLSHTSIATAVAATLIMRVTIVGLGVFYGFLAGLAATYYLRPIAKITA